MSEKKCQKIWRIKRCSGKQRFFSKTRFERSWNSFDITLCTSKSGRRWEKKEVSVSKGAKKRRSGTGNMTFVWVQVSTVIISFNLGLRNFTLLLIKQTFLLSLSLSDPFFLFCFYLFAHICFSVLSKIFQFISEVLRGIYRLWFMTKHGSKKSPYNEVRTLIKNIRTRHFEFSIH